MFLVKKCDHDKETTLARFERLQKAINFLGMHDPDGVVPLIIWDTVAMEVVHWTEQARRETLAYVAQINKAYPKTPWSKEGF